MKYRYTLELLAKGYGDYKQKIGILVLFGLLSSFTESLGVTAIIPLFSRLAGAWSSEDLGTKSISKILGLFDLGFEFKTLIIVIVAAFILKSIIVLVAQYTTSKIVADYERNVKNKILTGVLGAQWKFLLRQQVGYIETLLTKDVVASRKLFSNISSAVLSLSSLIVYVAIAFSISNIATMASLLLGSATFFIVKPIFYRAKNVATEVAGMNSSIAQYVFENISGIKTIKAGAREEEVGRIGSRYFDSYRNAHVKMQFLHVLSPALLEPLSVIFVVSLFAFLYTTGNFELGVFAAIMYLIHRIFQYITRIQSVLYELNVQTPHLQRIVDFSEKVNRNKERDSGDKKFEFRNLLEFSDVSFSYNDAKNVLSNVSFAVKKGEMVGIAGRSGAGKTTIVDLLLRLFSPSGGKISLDGVDISDIRLFDWRLGISYVPQEAFLINDTFANNIKFYGPDLEDGDLEKAAKMAYIYNFIQNTEDKFDTMAGERGVLLSGGEKQRLVLARVLARQPQILVLDEATSALDNESEAFVQEAILNLKGKMTVLVVAHRLNTLLSCDKVIFLEKGKIKEEGTPQELLRHQDSSFFQLYNIRESS